jgi:hypothetical protein
MIRDPAFKQVRVRPKKLTIAPSEIGILKALTPYALASSISGAFCQDVP